MAISIELPIYTWQEVVTDIEQRSEGTSTPYHRSRVAARFVRLTRWKRIKFIDYCGYYSQKWMWKSAVCAIDFWARLDYSPSKRNKLLQTAYENACLSRCGIMNWHKKYSYGKKMKGKVRVNEWRKTATSEINVNTIAVAIEEDGHLSIWASKVSEFWNQQSIEF